MIDHLGDQVPAFILARTERLRERVRLPEVPELLQLQNELHVAEGLDERNDGQVVLCGPPQNGLNVLLGVAVSGRDVSERAPEREHVFVFQEQSRGAGFFQKRENVFQEGQLRRGALQVEVHHPLFRNVPVMLPDTW